MPSVAFHIETSHLVCSANQMTGFYIKCNNGLKRVEPIWKTWIKPLIKPAALFSAPLYNNQRLLVRSIFDWDGDENVEML